MVDVLQEALARDESKEKNITKNQALQKTKAFIQIIHRYRDAAILDKEAPAEKVAIFDEAQRAWDAPKLEQFMSQKKGIPDFAMSEPEFLISIMDRHQDWAVIVCLIGGGQEIHTGEAGLMEWFDALRDKFSHWNVYVSNKINDSEYVKDSSVSEMVAGLNANITEELHLDISLRSFRSENVSELVKALLDVDKEKAKELYADIKGNYSICLTRDLEKAKIWVRAKARGTERFGLTASSGAKRLRGFGIWVKCKVEAKNWFLNEAEDVRSSYFLEDTATEFDIQGLELDWTIVCWDANFRFKDGRFKHFRFKGSKWQNINKEEDKNYLKNTYRVLLTRARQGLVIFIPKGDIQDKTRPYSFYDGTYNYLKEVGIEEI